LLAVLAVGQVFLAVAVQVVLGHLLAHLAVAVLLNQHCL
jgi:hypothetical protein